MCYGEPKNVDFCIRGLYGEFFLEENPEGVFLTATLSSVFLSELKEFAIDSYGGVHLVVSQDIVSPSFIFDCTQHGRYNLIMGLSSTINKQRVKFVSSRVIDFMHIKDVYGRVSNFCKILDSFMGRF
jgi:hypothetical protein